MKNKIIVTTDFSGSSGMAVRQATRYSAPAAAPVDECISKGPYMLQ